MLRSILFALLFVSASNCWSEIKVISWNLESDGAQISTLVQSFDQLNDIDFYGFSEVDPLWVNKLLSAAEKNENISYASILGETGGSDRLQIIYNSSQYQLIDTIELNHINLGGGVRAPLVGHFKNKATNKELLVMVNHLYRSKKSKRHQQATMLNQWAAQQSLPIIAMGDYNFDWDVNNGANNHDKGYDNMIKNNTFQWVKPQKLVRTQCNQKYNSVLDFVFISKELTNPNNIAKILFQETSYCTTGKYQKSDHRPIYAVIDKSDTPQNDLKKALLQQIKKIKNELNKLEKQVEHITQ
ncbi:endonuclease/exonuclease/phosphatase family protein [Aliikangiella sp. IMCC44359]|uniref:endonuclease/exonuclease/phosphatase family protein n=1 Tax=Aliikangiella sp. IMCC44359 TaxID=3459125 RepID=UPI00403B1EE6